MSLSLRQCDRGQFPHPPPHVSDESGVVGGSPHHRTGALAGERALLPLDLSQQLNALLDVEQRVLPAILKPDHQSLVRSLIGFEQGFQLLGGVGEGRREKEVASPLELSGNRARQVVLCTVERRPLRRTRASHPEISRNRGGRVGQGLAASKRPGPRRGRAKHDDFLGGRSYIIWSLSATRQKSAHNRVEIEGRARVCRHAGPGAPSPRCMVLAAPPASGSSLLLPARAGSRPPPAAGTCVHMHVR